jgi:hypothetical protein
VTRLLRLHSNAAFQARGHNGAGLCPGEGLCASWEADSVRPPQSPDDLLCRGFGEQFDLGLAYR